MGIPKVAFNIGHRHNDKKHRQKIMKKLIDAPLSKFQKMQLSADVRRSV